MSEIRPTQLARDHLHEMIALANQLVRESVNQEDPVDPPVRTLTKDGFLQEYLSHSQSLCDLLDNLPDGDDLPVDNKLNQARTNLAQLVDKLCVKLEKVNNLKFWMDNMICSRNSERGTYRD
jgi:hypothetical protein